MAKEKERKKIKSLAPSPTYTPIDASLNKAYIQPRGALKSNIVVSQEDLMPAQQQAKPTLQVRGALAPHTIAKPVSTIASPIGLPSMEQQLRTATTAFKPVAQPEAFGPPVPASVRRQNAAQQSPLTRAGEFAANLAEKLVPGSFGNKPVQRPIEGLSKIPNIPGVTTGPAANFIRGAGDAASLGLSSYLDRMGGNEQFAEGATQTGAGRAGQIAGNLVLPAGKLKAGASLISNIGRGVGAGSLLGAGIEAGEMATGRNNQTLGQRALDVGLSTALGGAGAGVIGGLEKGISMARNAPNVVARGALQAAEQVPTPSIAQLPTQITRAAVPPAEAMKGNWFTDVFGNQGVGIAAGRTPRGRNLATTEGQIVSNPLRNDIQGLKNQAASMARTAYTNAFDITNPLKYIDETAYETAQDVRRANNLANTTIQDKFVDLEGNVIGQSLKEIGNKVARGEGNAFEDYLILRHAKTRMERGENVYDPKLGMTPEKVQERLDVLDQRYPQFQGIANEWNGYTANLRQLGVDEGLISESQATAMQATNPNYAPMRRQFSTAEKYSQPFAMKTKGFSGQKAPIKEVSPTGSVRKIVSPVRSMIEQTGAWYNAALRNRVMQSVYNRIQADPESLKGIIEIVPDTAEATKKSIDEVNDLLATDGMEGLMEKLNDELSMMFKKNGQKGARTDNIVTAMIKGTPVKMRVENPEVFKALVGMGPEESNFALDIMGSLSKATKFGATGALAPLFAARSLTTDVATSLIQSKQPLMHMYDLMHSVFSSLANKLPQGTPGAEGLRGLAQDFQRTGGEYSAMLMGDRALNQSVGGILRKPFMAPSNVGKAIASPVTGTFKALNSISDISENLNRMAAYKGALRRQGNVRTPEAIRNAMRESQEITTNFSRKGAKSEGIEKFIPYSNAAVQGIRRFGVQWKKNPIKTALAVGGLVIAPKMYEYATFGDDPDYQKMTAREKYRNIIVGKNADGTFTKVPMPPEYNAIGAAVIDMLVAYKDGDPVNWRQSADAIANAYTPPIVGGALQGLTQGGGVEQSIRGALGATSISPFSAITAGEQGQSFTGAPIVSADLLELSPGERYDERTSVVAKEIGKRIGMAPVKVDYLVKAYGGDPARLLLPLTAQVGAGTPKNTLLKNFIVDPVFSNTLQTDYYDMKEKITQAEADFEKHEVPLPAWYNETTAELITSRKKGSMSKQLTDFKTKKREIQGNKSLNAEEKARQLRDIQAKINEIYLDANTHMIEGGVPTGR